MGRERREAQPPQPPDQMAVRAEVPLMAARRESMREIVNLDQMAARITRVQSPEVLVLRLRLALGDRVVVILMEPRAEAAERELRSPVIREVLAVMAVQVKNTLR